MTGDPPLVVPNRADLERFIKDPKTLIAIEAIFRLAGQLTPIVAGNAAAAASAAQETADANADAIETMQTAPYVTFGGSGLLENERVLTGDAGVSLDLATAGLIKVVVDALAILNALGTIALTKPVTLSDTLGVTGLISANGGLKTTGQTETDTLRINQTETVAAVVSDRWIAVNINGTARKLLLAS